MLSKIVLCTCTTSAIDSITRRRLQRLAKGSTGLTTPRKEGGLTEQRNQLTARIRAWEQLLPIYMPGLLQYQTDHPISLSTSSHNSPHPEDSKLWLPSHLPPNFRHRICVERLPEIEEKLRSAQCYDALNSIRHILKIKSRLVKFKNKNIRGQREGNRSRAIIDRVHERARASAEKYRAARNAKYQLSGPGAWEQELQVLADADIRSYQDPNQLRKRKGRRGTVEDGQLALQSLERDEPIETDDFSLLNQVRTRRDGTGETRRTLSWIWLSPSGFDDPDNLNDDLLRVEWAKSRARAARATEEVLLLREEMRRVLEFLEWKSQWWINLKAQRSTNVSKDLSEGLSAYAHIQSDLQLTLANEFRTLWKQPLHEAIASHMPANSTLDPSSSTQVEPNADDECDDDDEEESDESDENYHEDASDFEDQVRYI